MRSLKNHPFAIEAFFEMSLVLTYAVPMNELKNLIPECLELDTFDNRWAFIAVAIVKTKNLRIKGFPEFMGNDFILIGFRIFVRYTNNLGKKLRGLYILKSETNKKKMTFLGNVFSQYNYSTTDINFSKDGEKIMIASKKSGLDIEVITNNNVAKLPENSPFQNWKEARRFAGPLPFTFTYNNKTQEVLIIEGARENWIPKPVEVIKCTVEFLNKKEIPGSIPANAFIIENTPYCWKKGKKEIWKS